MAFLRSDRSKMPTSRYVQSCTIYNPQSDHNFILKMTVPLDEVEKVLTQSDLVSGDVSPHIALRSLVRVLRGPYQHCQGVVTEKSNQGRELIIMDPDNNENVSLPRRS